MEDRVANTGLKTVDEGGQQAKGVNESDLDKTSRPRSEAVEPREQRDSVVLCQTRWSLSLSPRPFSVPPDFYLRPFFSFTYFYLFLFAGAPRYRFRFRVYLNRTRLLHLSRVDAPASQQLVTGNVFKGHRSAITLPE